MSTFGSRLSREPFLERHHFLTFVAFAAAGLGIATLSIRQPERMRAVQDAGLVALGPGAKAGAGIASGVGGAWNGISSTWKARAELEKVHAELDVLRLASTERDALADENARLREMLDLKERLPMSVVPARVIFQERGPDWILLIDQGREAGIAEDQAVIAPEGVVGKVLSVGDGIARVQCVVDGDAGVAVHVGPQGRQADAIVADGTGDTCRLRHLDLLQDVQAGDVVVTSGFDLVYPRGLLLGTIESVEEPGVDRDVVVRPAVDFSRLENVLVIVSKDEAVAKARRERAEAKAKDGRRGT